MKPPRILCVDDDVQLLKAMEMGLTLYGFEVVTATHGIAAIMQYRGLNGEFAAILTDNEMPEMNGVEFTRTVRELGYEGVIIVISGRIKPDELRHYTENRVSGFFHKPFEMSLLAALLRGE